MKGLWPWSEKHIVKQTYSYLNKKGESFLCQGGNILHWKLNEKLNAEELYEVKMAQCYQCYNSSGLQHDQTHIPESTKIYSSVQSDRLRQ